MLLAGAHPPNKIRMNAVWLHLGLESGKRLLRRRQQRVDRNRRQSARGGRSETRRGSDPGRLGVSPSAERARDSDRISVARIWPQRHLPAAQYQLHASEVSHAEQDLIALHIGEDGRVEVVGD